MDTANPLDILKEEMDNEEISLRVNAIHRIRIVAVLLPNDKIKSQLIPYIDCKFLFLFSFLSIN